MSQADYLEGRYLSQDALSLYYRDYGEALSPGTPVLCLPGLTRNSADFHELAMTLKTGRRVLAPDLRGRGNSDHDPEASHYAPVTYLSDLSHLLVAADCHRVIVIGTSLGGLLAMGLGATKPTALKGVILNDIGPEIDPRGVARIMQYVGKTSPPADFPEAARTMKTLYGDALPGLSEAAWLEQAEMNYRFGEDGRLHLNYDPAISSAVAAPAETDFWPYFKSLRNVPLLALRGEMSDILSVETFAAMQEANPDMQAVTVANRGHAPLLNEADSLDAIRTFIETLEGS